MLKKKSLRVNTIRRAASNVPGVPGNLLINGLWFSSREFRNNLIGAGLAAEIPPMAFMGATINYSELEITQADLDAGNGEVKHTINGREITYKKPGINNVDMNVDWATCNVTEATLNLAKLSTMFPRQTRVATAAPAPAVQTEVIVDAPPAAGQPAADEVVEEIPPVETVVVEENLADANQNAGG